MVPIEPGVSLLVIVRETFFSLLYTGQGSPINLLPGMLETDFNWRTPMSRPLYGAPPGEQADD